MKHKKAPLPTVANNKLRRAAARATRDDELKAAQNRALKAADKMNAMTSIIAEAVKVTKERRKKSRK